MDIINVKVDREIKKKAKKVAEELGLSLSGVVNAYLRQFIRSGTLFVSNSYEEPSDFLRAAMREAEEDRKRNKQISFANSKDALDFVDKIITSKKEKKNK